MTPKEKLDGILMAYGMGELDRLNAMKDIFNLFDVSDDSLQIQDIRNKLSPLTHLISMVEIANTDLINTALPEAKHSINYLSQRQVYFH